VIAARMKDVGHTQLTLGKVFVPKRSQTWVSQYLLTDPARQVALMAVDEPENLERVAKALEWTVEELISQSGAKTLMGRITKSSVESEPTAYLIGYSRHPISYYANGGKPVDALDYVFIRDDERKHLRPATRFAVIVGTSMTDPLDPFGPHSLQEGEVAWVDTNRSEPTDGEVFLIHLSNGGETVKQLEKVGEEWWCRSYDRANHPTFKLEDEAQIIGAVYRKQAASTPFKPRK